MEIEEKCKNKRINKAAKPSAHSSLEKEFRNYEKSESENFGNRNEVINKQSVQSMERMEPRKLGHEQLEIYGNRRGNNHRNFDSDNGEPLEIGENLNQNRTCRATICNRSTRRARVNQYNRETEDDSDLSDNNHTRPTTHFSFDMTQTPFQIMSNWPITFRNNKEDSPAHFWTT